MSTARVARPCTQCGAQMTGKVENFRYDASGLPGVVLEGVMVHRCPKCGEYEVTIENVQGLHDTLARFVVAKRERLSPAEIRFLRTHLGYSSVDFARKIGVSVPTVSRWERHDKPLGMKPTVERLLRLMVLAGDTVKNYPLEEMATLEPKTRPLRLHSTKGTWTEAKAV